MVQQEPVSTVNKAGEVFRRITVPVFREEMIIADIQDDAGVSAQRLAEQVAAGQGGAVVVGIGVDPAVKEDTVDDPRAVRRAGGAFDEISDETAEHKFGVAVSQVGVGQIVHPSVFLPQARLRTCTCYNFVDIRTYLIRKCKELRCECKQNKMESCSQHINIYTDINSDPLFAAMGTKFAIHTIASI